MGFSVGTGGSVGSCTGGLVGWRSGRGVSVGDGTRVFVVVGDGASFLVAVGEGVLVGVGVSAGVPVGVVVLTVGVMVDVAVLVG